MTVGLGQSWFPAWKNYKKSLEKRKVKVILIDFFNPGWANRLKKIDKKIDFYIWHSDTWEDNYRQIHDRIYFIEKILKKPIFPDLNQYYSFNDKIKQKELFDYFKLPQIPTYIYKNKHQALKKIDELNYPIIIKDAYSAAGDGIFKINSKKEAKKIANKTFKKGYEETETYIYLQNFIPNLKKDLRVITVGSEVATAYWRQSNTDWKHNISKGAEASFDNIPKIAEKFCINISKKMKFHWMAYDLIIVDNSIKLIEWTCNFGCKAPRENNIDIRDKLIEYIIKNYKKIK